MCVGGSPILGFAPASFLSSPEVALATKVGFSQQHGCCSPFATESCRQFPGPGILGRKEALPVSDMPCDLPGSQSGNRGQSGLDAERAACLPPGQIGGQERGAGNEQLSEAKGQPGLYSATRSSVQRDGL